MDCTQTWRPGGLASFVGSATHTDTGAPSCFISEATGLAVMWEHRWEGVGEVGTWLGLSRVAHWETASLT